MKDLGSLQFSNSGVKVEIMWGYASGANICGAKVVFIKKRVYGVKWFCGIPWSMVQTTKINPM